jgi:uncharacterized protein (DUF433 family)
MLNYKNYIESNHNIMLGKPIIRETRITVELILTKISEGLTTSEILEMFPHLNQEQILACLEYAADVIGHEEILELA